MNLKEFDAKAFLLEKGERVGLGVALTVMVLMLIVSLFLPSRGFFSGSPAAKADPLRKDAESLDRALRDPNNKPRGDDEPGEAKDRLINLDTDPLRAQFYVTQDQWFEPSARENPARRPPSILNAVESALAVARVSIDTYLFNNDFSKVYVLRDPEKRGGKDGPAGNNPYAKMMQGAAGRRMGGGPGAGRLMGAGNNPALQNLQGEGADEGKFVPRLVPLDSLSSADKLARQPQPARMALIAASFPYRAQLEEFKNKLRLKSIDEVLGETVKDGKEELAAFRFLGVKVQRKEVDANGKDVTDWKDVDLTEAYRPWLLTSSLPFQADDAKYDVLKFLAPRMVMPRLREFHEEVDANPASAMMAEGAMGMGMGGRRPPGMRGGGREREAPRPEPKSAYPDLLGKLDRVREALTRLGGDADAQKLVKTASRFNRTKDIDLFDPYAAPPPPEPSGSEPKEGDAGGLRVPDFCLLRLVDIDIQPGKFYRYRFKVRMANPNYGHEKDVASLDYAKDRELVSRQWYEVKETAHVPPETIYYVVDQKRLPGSAEEAKKLPRESALTDMWKYDPDRARQVVFQFHRWVGSALIDKGDRTPVPIGEWVIADRVFVARGEFVGRRVKVDLPVWKWAVNGFILPHDPDNKKVTVRTAEGGAKKEVKTGVQVNFGTDNPEDETILVDFEGGDATHEASKTRDVSGVEVLMLTADGRLLARNGAPDARDDERRERREKVLARIAEVRDGGKGGKATRDGGGLDRPGGR